MPAWTLGLILLAFIVALIAPKKVEAAFAHRSVQGAAAALVVAFLLLGVLSGGTFDQMRARMQGKPVLESYEAPLEKVAWAVSSPHRTLKLWALDHLRLHPRGEAQIPLVRQGLKDADPFVRSQAIWTFSTMGPSAQVLVPDVLPLVEDPDGRVQGTALHVAGKWVGLDQWGRLEYRHPISAPILEWSPDDVDRLRASLLRLHASSDDGIRRQAKQLMDHIEARFRRKTPG